MYIASNGIKTAVIERDPEPRSPRDPDHQENLGTMVCWHRRYNLGDKHTYARPDNFASDLAKKHLSVKDILTAIKNGEISALRLEPGAGKDSPYLVMTDVSLDLRPGREQWEEQDWRVSRDLEVIPGRGRFDLQSDILDFCSSQELIRLCDKYGDVAILPLYLYDHSMLSMSTGSFVGRAHHAEWDSGQVGYIYMDKETAMANLGQPKETMRIARLLPDYMRTPVLVNSLRGFQGSVREQLIQAGFEPVTSPAHIRNNNEFRPEVPLDKPLIDEDKIRSGSIFRKDCKLYEFKEIGEHGVLTMEPIATYNPDIQHLTEEQWRKRALNVLEGEVQEYDCYLQGEVYGYRLFEGMNEVDACWGFNPGGADIRTLMQQELGFWYEDKLQFEWSYDESFDLDAYFETHDFPALREQIKGAVTDFMTCEAPSTRVYPFAMSQTDILANKDGVLNRIVTSLYADHAPLTAQSIHSAVEMCVGPSREVLPRLTVHDLDPNRDYTAEELMAVLQKKPALTALIAGAQTRKEAKSSVKGTPSHEQTH